VLLGLLFFSRSFVFFLKKERISRQHVTWCGRRRVACQLRIQPLLWWLKKSGLRVFFTKKLIFFTKTPIFQPFQPQNTLKTPRNQPINLINPKRSRPLKQTIKNIASLT